MLITFRNSICTHKQVSGHRHSVIYTTYAAGGIAGANPIGAGETLPHGGRRSTPRVEAGSAVSAFPEPPVATPAKRGMECGPLLASANIRKSGTA